MSYTKVRTGLLYRTGSNDVLIKLSCTRWTMDDMTVVIAKTIPRTKQEALKELLTEAARLGRDPGGVHSYPVGKALHLVQLARS